MAWFKDWFGTPYYKMLYRHRNDEEASVFLDNLIKYLSLKPMDKVLDLACGRGRHSKYLASKGLDVTGIDLAEDSIAEAQKSACTTLHFMVHDMREPFPGGKYTAIINAFTSFGYFDTEEEDIKTLCNVRNALEDSGCFVIDYLNSKKVAKEILPHSKSTCEKVNFDIRKHIENKFIIKDIIVDDQGEEYHFSERVKLLDKADFEKYFQAAGLEIKATFGNYKLDSFDEISSERLILIANKRNLQS